MYVDTIRHEGDKITHLRSPEYNYSFNHRNGFFARWGKTLDDDPEYSPYGPEILDVEISTVCSKGCKFCYKGNEAGVGHNMSEATFKQILSRIPNTVRQIALGIGDIDGNRDLEFILNACYYRGIIPNITINGSRMNGRYDEMLAEKCGAVAVSRYDPHLCYEAVHNLTSLGMEQVNIHAMLSAETFDDCMQTIKDAASDRRLEKLNAIVFLWLKQKGRGSNFQQLKSLERFKELIDAAFDAGINFGFDSCSSANFLRAVRDHKDYKRFEMMVEPCESTLFSYYINVDGIGFPCSFTEGNPAYHGVNVAECNDFIKDVWMGEEAVRFREAVLGNKDAHGCRMCPLYDLELKR